MNKILLKEVSRIRVLIKELSPDSAGFEELYNSVKDYPEVLEYLKFGSLKSLREYLLNADYSEFDEIKSEVDYFIERRKKYLKSEIDEIERAAQGLNRDENINVSVDDIFRALDNAREVTLPQGVWSKLENTESNKIKKGEMNKVIALAKKYNKQNPKELKKAIQSGDYKRPLIIKFGDRFHLVAGNTRLCTAAAMGVKPKVLIGELF